MVQSGNGFPTPSTGATIISSDKNNISFTSTQWTYAGVESGFIKVKANETYTFSASFTTPTNRFFITQYNESKVRLSTLNSIVNPLQNTTFTTTNDGYITIAFTNTTTAQTTYKIENIQLEQSSTASSYEEYKSNSLTIDLQGNELCSLPNGTKDELVVENGRAKIIKRIGKVVLDGSENYWFMDKELTNTVRFYTSEILANKAKQAQPILSNYFVTATSINNINNDDSESAYVLNRTQPAIRINKSIANTLATFKTWLSTHNVEVYYDLETPIDIEITDPTLLAQLNALEQITQYKHTYITITGDNLTPEADFTYINNVVINNTDSVLGKDTYWNDEVPTQQDLPSKAQEGEIRIVQDTEDVYIYNGTKWVPFDKNSEVDLSNYLTKDNTTPWVPTGPFNPSTKKYVDDSVGGIHVPTKTSQLQNDSGFVIKTTNELTNYYTKNNTYTKNEVDALVAGGSGASDYSDLTNKPKINNVELSGNKSLSDLGITNFSGDYNDLSNKPTIPTALSELSSDESHRVVTDIEKSTWNNKSSFSGNYNDLSNKPTIPTVPTNVSAFINDAGYLTEHQDISGKQDKLVSGTNIKTIDGNSILGSGNVDISGDTLPIGAIVDFDGTTVPNGYEEVNETAVNLKSGIIHSVTPIDSTNYDDGWGGTYYYKVGSRIHLHVAVALTTKKQTNITTLPIGYRPRTKIVNTCSGGDLGVFGTLQVSPDGKVHCYSNGIHLFGDISFDTFED